MSLFEMQGLLAGKCLPGDMFVSESLSEYFLRQFNQRDELARQVSALQLSHDNIINSLGIKGDGPWSKLVIEYVMGLVAENEKLKATITEINNELYGQGFKVSGWHLNGDLEPLDNWFTDNGWDVPETINTDAAIAEIGAKAVDEFARTFNSETIEGSSMVMVAKTFAANLRAGRKGQ